MSSFEKPPKEFQSEQVVRDIEQEAATYAHLRAGQADEGYWDRYWDAYYDYLGYSEDGDPEYGDRHADQVFTESSTQDFFPQGAALQEVLQYITMLTEHFQQSRGGGRVPRNSSEYAFFRTSIEQQELYIFCKALAEHLHEKGYKDLVIVDRSSRPLYVGVREYWQAKYPDEKMPGIYFINPKGFKNWQSLSYDELSDAQLVDTAKGGRLEGLEQVRWYEEIAVEFAGAYPKLVADKDKQIMIFDTCIHSGDTLYAVVDVFKKMGFSQVKIGTVSSADPHSRVKADYYITDIIPEKGCYPFDQDRMIEKTFDHVFSRRSNDAVARAAGIQLRKEIKRIVQNHLQHRV